MGIGFFAFGLTMILRPDSAKANFDRFADRWKQGSWHPYKMPVWGLRLTGTAMILGAVLFLRFLYGYPVMGSDAF
jgi:hypothetical protein